MASWLFRPPIVREGPMADNALMVRYKMPRGVSVLKSGGTWTQKRYPTDVEIAAAQVFYAGGHEHTVDDAAKAELVSAGYGDYITGPL